MVIQIPLLNDALKGFDPDSISEEENLKGEQVHQLRAFIRVVERYNEELSRIPEIGSPFNTIKRVVGIFLLRIKEHRNQRKQAIGRLGVRHILSLILELKRIRYEVILKETEHRVKIR